MPVERKLTRNAAKRLATPRTSGGNPLRYDPTRTGTLRRAFAARIRRAFQLLRGRIVKLIKVDDAFGFRERMAANQFCPTGEGGGVDPSCSPSSGSSPGIVGRIRDKLASTYARMKERYGPTGAKVVMGAVVALLPVPIPGTSLIPVGIAEGVRAVGKLFEGVKNFDPDQARNPDGTWAGGAGGVGAYVEKKLKEELDKREVMTGERKFADTASVAASQILARANSNDSKEFIGRETVKSVRKVDGGIAVETQGTVVAAIGRNGKEYMKRVLVSSADEDAVREAVSTGREVPGLIGGYVVGKAGKVGTVYVAEGHRGDKGGLKKVMGDMEAAGYKIDADSPKSEGWLRAEAKREYKSQTTNEEFGLDEDLLADAVQFVLDAYEDAGQEPPTYRDVMQGLRDQLGQSRNELVVNPFVSEEQRRACYAKDDPDWDCGEWEEHTPQGKLPKTVTNANEYAFHTDPQKIVAFQRWLKAQLLELVIGRTQEELWEEYTRQGFLKGAGRTFDDWSARHPETAEEGLDFYRGSRQEFLRSSFGRPESVEKVKLLAGRSFDDLENITADMSTKMSRALTDGLVQGKHPTDIADDLVEQVGLSQERAELIARTEIIRAHAEGQLQAMEDLGVADVGVQVEWSTAAGDTGLFAQMNVCPECEAMSGSVFSIEDARGMIPAHPNCRCAFIPVIPKPGEKPTENRRRVVRNHRHANGCCTSRSQQLLEQYDRALNMFCPTGEGGGVDPTCSPNNGSSGAAPLKGRLKALAERVEKAQGFTGLQELALHDVRGLTDKQASTLAPHLGLSSTTAAQLHTDLVSKFSGKQTATKPVTTPPAPKPVPTASAPKTQDIVKVVEEAGGHGGLVDMVQVRAAFPNVPKGSLDEAIRQAMRERKINGSRYEGRHGTTKQQVQARVEDDSGFEDHIGYLAIRTENIATTPTDNESYFATCERDEHGWCVGTTTTGRGEKLDFAKKDASGKWVLPTHVQKLNVPPSWKDVVYNPNPDGTLMAMGVDSKGRVQMKYSNNFRAQQDAAKFGRVRELLKKREGIFRELDRDARNPQMREHADCLRVVMQTGMRPGSDNDTKSDYKSYGATTLEGRHVIANEDGSVTLRLVTGKNKGREVDFPVHDKTVASMLKDRAKGAGKDGRLFDTDAQQLRDYSKDKDGGGFKTKDHRTALGTETAIRSIKEQEPPRSVKEYKSKVKEVATRVAKTLGNTPSVALKSYIDPLVFSHWRKAAGI